MQNNNKTLVSVTTLFTTRNANITRYFNEVNHIKPLAADSLDSLYLAAHRGDAKAVNTLVGQNLKLVISIAKRYEFASTLALEDLINEGNIGLLMAVRTFDPNKGFKFTTIASLYIRQQIIEAIRAYGRTIRYPKSQEQADYLCTSADAPIATDNEGNEVTFLDTLRSDLMADEATELSDVQLVIKTLLSKVRRQKDKEIVTKLFGIGCREHSQRELSDLYDCTEEAIRQIKFRVLDEMSRIAAALDF